VPINTVVRASATSGCFNDCDRGIDEIIKIRGENVYSVFHLVKEKKLVVSINLKEVEGMLRSYDFFRVHKSYIINLKCITRYIKGEGGIVILTDGSEVEVSRRNKLEFLKRITTGPR